MASSPLEVVSINPSMFMTLFTYVPLSTLCCLSACMRLGSPVLVPEAALHASVTLHLERDTCPVEKDRTPVFDTFY